MQFTDIHLKRGARSWKMAIWLPPRAFLRHDLALRVVERYYGREIAQKTATT